MRHPMDSADVMTLDRYLDGATEIRSRMNDDERRQAQKLLANQPSSFAMLAALSMDRNQPDAWQQLLDGIRLHNDVELGLFAGDLEAALADKRCTSVVVAMLLVRLEAAVKVSQLSAVIAGGYVVRDGD